LNPLELTLGIMTAVGGFVDISELVFAAKAGSKFGYALIWVFALATLGIIIFSEMSGRVAAVAKQPVFNLMRHRLGLKLGLLTLAASIVSNLITCAAEIGGVSLILNYLTGAPYVLMAIGMTAVFVTSIWVLFIDALSSSSLSRMRSRSCASRCDWTCGDTPLARTAEPSTVVEHPHTHADTASTARTAPGRNRGASRVIRSF